MVGSSVRPAVFLDRDGTIIEDRSWLRDPDDVVFFADTFDALRRLQAVAELFIVTHQSGIAKGVLTASEAAAVNQFIVARLAVEGVRIRAVFTCPHDRKAGCDCIKPNPLFAYQAAVDYNVSLEYSFAIGDHPHDVQFAHHFGGKGIYVLTGHGQRHVDQLTDHHGIAAGIKDAVDCILAQINSPPASYIGASAASRKLKQGEVVAIPTETVYGMAANALDEQAVARVFAIKQRPALDPLIVHLADADVLQTVAVEVPERATVLASTFWPGPLTLVLPKHPSIPDLVTSGLETVAVRVPRHPIARRIIRDAGCPVAAPSANRFSTISPTCARHVFDQFGDALSGIVDGGSCRVGVESTILGFWDDRVWLLRPGGISVEVIEACIGPIYPYRKKDVHDVRAPGSLPRHYAPATPLELCEAGELIDIPPHTGVVVFGTDVKVSGEHVVNLSPKGDLVEAAASLYATLRRLDAAGLGRIMVQRLPEEGLGRTMNDRLMRAATK